MLARFFRYGAAGAGAGITYSRQICLVLLFEHLNIQIALILHIFKQILSQLIQEPHPWSTFRYDRWISFFIWQICFVLLFNYIFSYSSCTVVKSKRADKSHIPGPLFGFIVQFHKMTMPPPRLFAEVCPLLHGFVNTYESFVLLSNSSKCSLPIYLNLINIWSILLLRELHRVAKVVGVAFSCNSSRSEKQIFVLSTADQQWSNIELRAPVGVNHS